MALATAIVGAAVIGAAASNSASKRASKAANAQADVGHRQADIAERQLAISEEQWARYKTNYQPMEDQLLEEAKSFGSIAGQNKAATQAQADVTSSFASLRERLNRTPGINANSQAYAQENTKLALTEAATGAAAQTAARERSQAMGVAARQDAVNSGKGVASGALSSMSGAAGTLGSAGGMFGRAAESFGQRANNISQGVGNMFGGLYQAGAFDGLSQWMSGGGGGTNATGTGLVSSGGGEGFWGQSSGLGLKMGG